MRQTDLLPSWFGVVPQVRERLDPILDDYESDWQEHGQPNHQEYLRRCDDGGDVKRILLRELLHLDDFFNQPNLESQPAANQSLDPHTIGDYKIIRRVGSGGFGVVFLGFDAFNNRRVAVKVARPAWLVDKDAHALATEAHILSGFDHPNIVNFYESGVFGHNEWYVVTEWIEGLTLNELLQEGLMHPDQATEIAVQIADALCYAHDQKIAHLDIKPRNVMIDQDGHVKLLDFGTAKILNGIAENSFTGRVSGSLRYMAPEQKRGDNDQIDAQSDIFAVGLVLHEMLAGKGDQAETTEQPLMSLRRVNRQIPAQLANICRTALRENKSRRYTNMHEMREDLQRCLNNLHNIDLADYQAVSLSQARKKSAAQRRKAAIIGLPAIVIVSLFLMFSLPNSNWFGTSRNATGAPTVLNDEIPKVLVWLKTNPDGARVYFYKLDSNGEPIPETEVFAGRGPASAELAPGDYYVSAILDNGEFNETFRAVPWPGESHEMNKCNAWRNTELGFQLPSINIKPFDPAGMVLVDSVWLDESLVGASNIPQHKFEVGNYGTSVGGARTKIKHPVAAEYLESIGKRLPFSRELTQATQSSAIEPIDISEWTSSLDQMEFITLVGGGARRRASHYVIQSDERTETVAQEFATSPAVGFRGVRNDLPLRDQ